MLKNMSKETFYFSHDSNARNDIKIKAMRKTYGLEGYGMYWLIIETLREEVEHKLPIKEYVFDGIATDAGLDAQFIQKYIDDCINKFELFQSDGEYFWSRSLMERMEKMHNIREKRKAAARASVQKRLTNDDDNNTNAQQMLNKCSTNAQQMLSKTQQNKINENKINENKDIPPYIPPSGGIGEQEEKKPRKKKEFIAPTLNEVIAYFREKGSTDDLARKAYDYYTTGGWKDAKGDPVLNWKQKMLINWIDKQHTRTMHMQAEPPPPGKSPWANMVRNPNYYTDDQYKAELERCENKAKALEQELDFAGAEAWRERARELERKKKRGIITNDPKLEWLPKQ